MNFKAVVGELARSVAEEHHGADADTLANTPRPSQTQLLQAFSFKDARIRQNWKIDAHES